MEEDFVAFTNTTFWEVEGAAYCRLSTGHFLWIVSSSLVLGSVSDKFM